MRTLLENFVVVADEVGRLQRGEDLECRTFQSFCEAGHYGGRAKPTSTRQGIYAVTPGGRFLASINTTDPGRLAAMLARALERWHELPEEHRSLDEDAARGLEALQRFEDRRPEDGLVLAVYMRDLGEPGHSDDWRQSAFNEDQAWFTREEMLAFVPTTIEVGAVASVPVSVVMRLVRLHLVDAVRGQTPPLPEAAVREASLRTELVGIDGEQLTLLLTGRSHAEERGRWPVRSQGEREEQVRGISTTLRGRAVFDREKQRFAGFELVALGERWGATQYNERDDDRGPAPIGFAFVLAPSTHPRVAPAFWWDYGWRR